MKLSYNNRSFYFWIKTNQIHVKYPQKLVDPSTAVSGRVALHVTKRLKSAKLHPKKAFEAGEGFLRRCMAIVNKSPLCFPE